jgi:FtsH-binding integral membrane protein
MSYSTENPYQSPYDALTAPAAWAAADERSAFVRRTYLHLAGAIGLFVALEAAIFTLVPDATLESLMGFMVGGRWSWLIVLGAFMGVSYLAQNWANSGASPQTQYAGLGLYVVAEAIIFVPLLYIASKFAPQVIPAAGVLTLVMFGGLTAIVMITRTDLSGMGKYLWWGGIAGLATIGCAIVFNFQLGVWFSGLMIALAGGYILYDTSNVMHRYRTDQHVAAALALFASVALLLWYVIQLLMSLNRR